MQITARGERKSEVTSPFPPTHLDTPGIALMSCAFPPSSRPLPVQNSSPFYLFSFSSSSSSSSFSLHSCLNFSLFWFHGYLPSQFSVFLHLFCFFSSVHFIFFFFICHCRNFSFHPFCYHLYLPVQFFSFLCLFCFAFSITFVFCFFPSFSSLSIILVSLSAFLFSFVLIFPFILICLLVFPLSSFSLFHIHHYLFTLFSIFFFIYVLFSFFPVSHLHSLPHFSLSPFLSSFSLPLLLHPCTLLITFFTFLIFASSLCHLHPHFHPIFHFHVFSSPGYFSHIFVFLLFFSFPLLSHSFSLINLLMPPLFLLFIFPIFFSSCLFDSHTLYQSFLFLFTFFSSPRLNSHLSLPSFPTHFPLHILFSPFIFSSIF